MRANNAMIDTLQVLRCLAFIGVFLSHVGWNATTMAGMGYWGVSVFLVLSGFTMVYSYYGKGRIRAVSVRDNLRFAMGKVGKLYPLYVLTTLAVFIFFLIGDEKHDDANNIDPTGGYNEPCEKCLPSED